jgi:hypothetical protein
MNRLIQGGVNLHAWRTARIVGLWTLDWMRIVELYFFYYKNLSIQCNLYYILSIILRMIGIHRMGA